MASCVLRIVQQGIPNEVVDQACDSFLIRIFFLIVGHEAIRIRGATLEGKGEDDLLLGRGSNIGGVHTERPAGKRVGPHRICEIGERLGQVERGLAQKDRGDCEPPQSFAVLFAHAAVSRVLGFLDR